MDAALEKRRLELQQKKESLELRAQAILDPTRSTAPVPTAASPPTRHGEGDPDRISQLQQEMRVRAQQALGKQERYMGNHTAAIYQRRNERRGQDAAAEEGNEPRGLKLDLSALVQKADPSTPQMIPAVALASTPRTSRWDTELGNAARPDVVSRFCDHPSPLFSAPKHDTGVQPEASTAATVPAIAYAASEATLQTARPGASTTVQQWVQERQAEISQPSASENDMENWAETVKVRMAAIRNKIKS